MNKYNNIFTYELAHHGTFQYLDDSDDFQDEFQRL